MSPTTRAPHTRPLALLLTALSLMAALSGCMGDQDADTDVGSTGTGTGNEVGTGTDEDPEDEPKTLEERRQEEKEKEGPTEQVPEAHYHHYWGKPALPKVKVFEGDVQLDMDDCFDSDSAQDPPCFGPEPHMGSAEFNLEDDGDQVPEGFPTGHNEGHADTVLVGTSHLVASFDWSEDLMGDSLLFYYKPANSPIYQPQGGIVLTKEDATHTIELGRGWADPAHQIYVSRWSFMLVANSGPLTEAQVPLHMANGTAEVLIEAHNGGVGRIDPPHPDHWVGRDTLDLGKTEGSFKITSVYASTDAASHQVAEGTGHDDIKMPVKSVVPAGTQTLVVTAWVNRTDPLAGTAAPLAWGLKYHGANDLSYLTVGDIADGPEGSKQFTILVPPESVDGPYERESYWAFGIYPILQDQEQVGHLEGTYSLHFEVHKDPEFTYY